MKKYPLLKIAYDFDKFEGQGTQLIQQLTHYLKQQQKPESKATNWQKANDELTYWQNYEFKNLNSFFEDLIDHSVHVHNPKYMGHQVAVPAPLSVLANMISSLFNNGSAVYEMGRASNSIERVITDLFCKVIGYDAHSNGIMTSGGTLANMTALLSARQALKNSDIWQDGTDQKLAVLVSAQAHYSIDRAIRVMGFGSKGLVLVPVDNNFSMDNKALENCYLQTIDQGYTVLSIVGSACSTATGRFDDLDFIGQFCQKHKLWFHVDGAHGAAVVFSKKHKALVRGIEKADSVVIDTHKMMMTPALSTVVLFKDKAHGNQTFQQKAKYLFADANLDDQWFNSGLRTFECTKRMMCLKFYVLWKTYGIELFEQNIDCLFELGHIFSNMIKDHDSFQLAVNVQSNIVCFRYIDKSLTAQLTNMLNIQIRQNLLEESHFYIVQTELSSNLFLRVTLMNPLTEESHLKDLLEYIVTIAKKLKSSN